MTCGLELQFHKAPHSGLVHKKPEIEAMMKFQVLCLLPYLYSIQPLFFPIPVILDENIKKYNFGAGEIENHRSFILR